MPDAGSLLVPPIFLWSAVVHIGVILVILKLQKLVSQVTNPHGARYWTISEFLVSVAWVIMSFESASISIMWSEGGGLLALGLRLFFTSLIFHEVYMNPCGALFYYLTHWPSKKLSAFLRPLGAQMLAIPFGVVVSIIMWRTAAIVNTDYAILLEKELNYFLDVPPLTGFLVEAFITFLTSLPKIFITSPTFLSVFDPIFVVFIVSQFTVFTGANMNPLTAFSGYLMWHAHYLGVRDLFVHFFVFFLGPLAGTVLAVGVHNSYKGGYKRKLS